MTTTTKTADAKVTAAAKIVADAKAAAAKATADAKAARTAAREGKAAATAAKRDLANRAILALGEMVKNLDDSTAVLQGMTKDEAAQTVSQWTHHLPVGGEWPTGTLPTPDRSEWRTAATAATS